MNFNTEKKDRLNKEDLMVDDHNCGMTFRGDPTRDVFGVYDGFVRTTAARAATHSGRLRVGAL